MRRNGLKNNRKKKIFIASPDGQSGGGMGRVKDYILYYCSDDEINYKFYPLITRNNRGYIYSIILFIKSILNIFSSSLRRNIALVHINMGDRGSIARKAGVLFAARLCGVPAILHFHGVELDRHYADSPPFLRWLIRSPFRAATAVIVLGNGFRDWLVQELGISPDKIDILHNGVDAPAAPPVRAFGEDKEQTILFLGNLLERKGLSDLLNALAMLERGGPEWRAVIAGGGDIEHYSALAAALHIGDRVEFVGWVDQPQVRDLLQSADMLVLPSYDEGLPLVILEALGCGLPVICTPVGAIPETLSDGETAIFCPVGDPRILSSKIAGLLQDRAKQSALSQRGLDLFRRFFSLLAFRDRLFAIYRKRAGLDLPGGVEQPETMG